MDRLSSYASREEDSKAPEERQRAEEEATTKMLERLSVTKHAETDQAASHANGQPPDTTSVESETSAENQAEVDKKSNPPSMPDGEASGQMKGAADGSGIPENVKLFEIFHEQVMNLVSMQRLPIQDITALLVSLANLAL